MEGNAGAAVMTLDCGEILDGVQEDSLSLVETVGESLLDAVDSRELLAARQLRRLRSCEFVTSSPKRKKRSDWEDGVDRSDPAGEVPHGKRRWTWRDAIESGDKSEESEHWLTTLAKRALEEKVHGRRRQRHSWKHLGPKRVTLLVNRLQEMHDREIAVLMEMVADVKATIKEMRVAWSHLNAEEAGPSQLQG